MRIKQIKKKDRLCTDCKFCLTYDYGYSDYTVEGTSVFCLKNKHPKNGFDRFYGGDENLKYASKCPGFGKGHPVEITVEHPRPIADNVGHLDPKIVRLIKRWEKNTAL